DVDYQSDRRVPSVRVRPYGGRGGALGGAELGGAEPGPAGRQAVGQGNRYHGGRSVPAAYTQQRHRHGAEWLRFDLDEPAVHDSRERHGGEGQGGLSRQEDWDGS